MTAPFRLNTAVGEAVSFVALVHHFGASAGTLAGTIEDDFERLTNLAKQSGHYVSLLNPDSYKRYDRQLFIDTLNEWGWFGPGAAPTWYTGEPWTN